jgi:hypothetical protein
MKPLLSRWTRRNRQPIRRPSLPQRPLLERLEDRLAPAGNLLVSAPGQYFREYTPTGSIVRAVAIPQPGDANARDLVGDATGRIFFYNGTFTPFLSTYSSSSATWTHTTASGWSTVNNQTYGGIGLFGNYVFVTDMATGSSPYTANGIVRFNLTDGSYTRFASGNDFIDLNVGLDGNLYALANQTVSVYDPTSLALVRTVTLPYADYRAVAANAAGDIYVASAARVVTRFNSAGTQLATVNLATYASSSGTPDDIDISSDGTTIAVGAASGHIFQMTSSLTGVTNFNIGVGTAFVSFAPTVTATPPPALPTLSLASTSVSVTEGNSGTKALTFTLNLSQASTTPVTVDYATTDGTASAGSDYTAAAGTLTFAPGQTSKTISVTVFGDTDYEASETFTLNLSNQVGANLSKTQATGTITNDDAAPVITVSDATVNEGNSGTSYAVFTLTLSKAISQAVTLSYSTADNTAISGSDYQWVSGGAAFQPGQTTTTISIAVYGDTVPEADKTFFLNLSSPVNATLSRTQATGTIVDDEPISFLVTNAYATEGNTGTVGLTYSVYLSKPLTTTASVDYATGGGNATPGSDYTPVSGTFTFAPGETYKSVTVTVFGDTTVELDEQVYLNLSNNVGAPVYNGPGVGIIYNDDKPNLSVGDVSANEGNSGSTTFNFPLTLSQPNPAAVTFWYYTTAGTATNDFASTSGIFTIPANQTTVNLPVTVYGDTTYEPNETFTLTIYNASNAIITRPTGTATIVNDDPNYGLSINDVSVTEGNSGSVNATFTVTLAQASTGTITVGYYTSSSTATSGSDYAYTSGTLTFAPGQTTATVAVPVYGDTLNETNETFSVVLNNPTGGAYLIRSTGVATIVNDDPLPSITVADASVAEGNSGTTALNFTVSLSQASGQYVYVNYATAAGTATAGSDFTSTSGLLSFSPGQTSKTVTVSVVTDTVNEPDETLYLNLSSPSNATIARTQGVGTILNDDLPPTVSVSDASVTEGNSGTALLGFTVSLSSPQAGAVTVSYATANGTATAGSDYLAASGTVTFNAGQTSQTVYVTVYGDTAYEPNETLTLTLSNPTGGVTLNRSVATGTINNDDAQPSLSINDVSVTEGDTGSTPANFTVTLSAASYQTVSVYWYTPWGSNTASPGRDYVQVNGTLLTFNPGETSKTVSVSVLGDTVRESSERFTAYLYSPTNATILRASATGTILDNDPNGSVETGPAVAGDVRDYTGSGTFTEAVTRTDLIQVRRYSSSIGTSIPVDERGIMEFNVGALGTRPSGPVSLILYEYMFNSTDQPVLIYGYAGDGVVTTADATRPAVLLGSYDPKGGLNWRSIPLDSQAVNSLLQSSSYLGLRFVGAAPTNTTFSLDYGVPVLNFSPDPLPTPSAVSVSDVSVVEGSAGSTTDAVFTVSLSQPSTAPVTLTYQTAPTGSADGSDYQAASGFLVFNPGETSKTVTVKVNQDTAVELDETFALQLTGVANAAVADGVGIGTIVNDDLPAITVDPASVVEGNAGTSFAVFTVRLSAPVSQTVTAHYATADVTPGVSGAPVYPATAGSDYLAADGTLTFAPGQTSLTVAVAVLGDKLVEADEQFALVVSDAVNATAGTSGVTGNVATIVNDDHYPVPVAGPDRTVDEGAAVTFDGSGSSDPDGDPLTYTWDFGDGSQASGPTATHVYADNGSYLASLIVSDGANTVRSTAVITVQNVAPTAAVAGPADAVPGQDRTYTFTATDPGSADQAAPFTYQIAWGDGTTQTVQGPGAGMQVTHTYDSPGNYAVTVTATDKDGATAPAASQSVSVVPAELQGSDLVIGGTPGDDQITVQPADDTSGQVAVTVNGQAVGTFAVAGQVVIYGGAGNDTIALQALPTDAGDVLLAQPAVLFGGAGDDTLDATGSAAANVLVGGEGNDLLLGGAGPDVLIGGQGTDTLRGGGGDDVLVGGSTDYDANLAGLQALRAVWSRTDLDYQTRVNYLTNSAVPPGEAPPAAWLDAGTTRDDGVADDLYGGAGLDLFFRPPTWALDRGFDLEAGEVS